MAEHEDQEQAAQAARERQLEESGGVAPDEPLREDQVIEEDARLDDRVQEDDSE